MPQNVRRKRPAKTPKGGEGALDAFRLPFERQDMVCWFHPVQIARTAFRSIFAESVTSLIDVRETEAALPPIHFVDRASLDPSPPKTDEEPFEFRFGPRHKRNKRHGGKAGVWIDFVADVGDGWEATYPVAELIGRKELTFRGLKEKLPRANLLVFGGDCVYPTPSDQQYRDRMEGPYDAALAAVPTGEPPPNLLAIPGNHDWYDGLMSFMRVFCHGGKIGAWRTRQRRSYFAVTLPGNWSLWGIDIQLDSRIDRTQLDYFATAARTLRDENKSGQKPRLIICTALPAWLNDRPAYQKAFRNYWYFVRLAVSHECEPWVTLTGDLHHYSRYATEAGSQLITAGGGGSYLSATHDLPTMIRSPGENDEVVRLSKEFLAWRKKAGPEYAEAGYPYPSRADSRRIGIKTLAFPFLSRNWTCCLLLGVVYAWFAWLLRWSAGPRFPSQQLTELLSTLIEQPVSWRGVRGLWGFIGDTMLQYPSTWMPTATLIAGFTLFCVWAEMGLPRWHRWAWGGLHGLCHVALAGTTAWLLARVGAAWSSDFVKQPWEILLWFVAVVGVGGLAGGLLLGVYLFLSDRLLGWHVNEVFSAQSSPDYRNFIRMLVAEDGTLTLYPIGVRRVPRHWRERIGARPFESRYESRDLVPEPELIEGPIVINPQ